MSLYRCEQCGCVENTAFGFSAIRHWPDWPDAVRGKRLCSACGPVLFSDGTATGYGRWHDNFPRRPSIGYYLDQDQNLWSSDQVQAGLLPPHYRIVGRVVEDKLSPSGSTIELFAENSPSGKFCSRPQLLAEARELQKRSVGLKREAALLLAARARGFRNANAAVAKRPVKSSTESD